MPTTACDTLGCGVGNRCIIFDPLVNSGVYTFSLNSIVFGLDQSYTSPWLGLDLKTLALMKGTLGGRMKYNVIDRNDRRMVFDAVPAGTNLDSFDSGT